MRPAPARSRPYYRAPPPRAPWGGGPGPRRACPPRRPPPTAHGMNRIAESYVKLALAVGTHDADYVDAYYGPPEWKAEVDSAKPALAEIGARAEALLKRLGREPLAADEM